MSQTLWPYENELLSRRDGDKGCKHGSRISSPELRYLLLSRIARKECLRFQTCQPEILLTHKKIKWRKTKFSCFKLSNVVFIMQINVKMPTFVGILTFMSKINFMLI